MARPNSDAKRKAALLRQKVLDTIANKSPIIEPSSLDYVVNQAYSTSYGDRMQGIYDQFDVKTEHNNNDDTVMGEMYYNDTPFYSNVSDIKTETDSSNIFDERSVEPQLLPTIPENRNQSQTDDPTPVESTRIPLLTWDPSNTNDRNDQMVVDSHPIEPLSLIHI